MTTAALGRGKMHKRQYYTFECFSEIILQPNYPKACIKSFAGSINGKRMTPLLQHVKGVNFSVLMNWQKMTSPLTP